MEIIYKTGNLLDASEQIIVHGCNAQGAFASGVAGAIRERYPFAFHAYRQAAQEGLVLGEVVWAIDTSLPLIIGNAITQEFYGRDGKRYVNYDAIATCMQDVAKLVKEFERGEIDVSIIEYQQIAMPLIGAGLGGGDWSVIKKIIETESSNFQPVVYLMDGKVPS